MPEKEIKPERMTNVEFIHKKRTLGCYLIGKLQHDIALKSERIDREVSIKKKYEMESKRIKKKVPLDDWREIKEKFKRAKKELKKKQVEEEKWKQKKKLLREDARSLY